MSRFGFFHAVNWLNVKDEALIARLHQIHKTFIFNVIRGTFLSSKFRYGNEPPQD